MLTLFCVERTWVGLNSMSGSLHYLVPNQVIGTSQIDANPILVRERMRYPLGHEARYDL